MFDTIVLLSSAAEQLALSQVLLGHNPRLTLVQVRTVADLTALQCHLLERARLIAFATSVIVPKSILDQLGYGAINFHPGPPSYPGWAPAHFPLYNDETEFGATAHFMVERVDAGPIIDVATYSVPAGISPRALEGLTYAHLAKLFWRLAKSLATQAEELPTRPLHWGGKKYSRRDYRAMCDIPSDVSLSEFRRRMRIFGNNNFGMCPTIGLHGIQFEPSCSP
jgi:methionyl-tRNA formyltransferase